MAEPSFATAVTVSITRARTTSSVQVESSSDVNNNNDQNATWPIVVGVASIVSVVCVTLFLMQRERNKMLRHNLSLQSNRAFPNHTYDRGGAVNDDTVTNVFYQQPSTLLGSQGAIHEADHGDNNGIPHTDAGDYMSLDCTQGTASKGVYETVA